MIEGFKGIHHFLTNLTIHVCAIVASSHNDRWEHRENSVSGF